MTCGTLNGTTMKKKKEKCSASVWLSSTRLKLKVLWQSTFIRKKKRETEVEGKEELQIWVIIMVHVSVPTRCVHTGLWIEYIIKCVNLFSLCMPPLLLSTELLHFLIASPLVPLVLFPQLALSLLLLLTRRTEAQATHSIVCCCTIDECSFPPCQF